MDSQVTVVQGPVGPQGPQGRVGPVGPQGTAGAQGPYGPQGLQGPIGPRGLQGQAGPQGPRGILPAVVDESILRIKKTAEDAVAYNTNDRLELMTSLINQAVPSANVYKRVVVDDLHSQNVNDGGIITQSNINDLKIVASTDIPLNTAGTYRPVQYKNYLVGLSVQLSKPGNVTDADYTLVRQQMMNVLGFSETGGLGCGWFSELWVVDQNTQKLVRSRHICEMTRALLPNDWQLATFSRGPIISIGDGRFMVTIQNPKTYGLLLFDLDLNGISLNILNSYDITIGKPGLYSTDLASSLYDNLNNKVKWWLKGDDPKGIITKVWQKHDLTDFTYTDIVTDQPINLFPNNATEVLIAYVSSSSLAQYCVYDSSYSFKKMGALNPQDPGNLWYSNTGKIIMWAVIVNNGVVELHPVKQFNTCPDNYAYGNVLSDLSFVKHPETGEYYDAKIYYPLVKGHVFKNSDDLGVHAQSAGTQNLYVSTDSSKVMFEDILGSVYNPDGLWKYKQKVFDGGAYDGQSVIGVSDPNVIFSSRPYDDKNWYLDLHKTTTTNVVISDNFSSFNTNPDSKYQLFSFGEFVASNAQITSSTNMFYSSSVIQSDLSNTMFALLDHCKYLAFSPVIPVPDGSQFSYSAILRMNINHTQALPEELLYNISSDKDQDYRIGCGGIVCGDLAGSNIIIDVAVTNTMVYAIYERLPFAWTDPTDPNRYAAFTYMIPIYRCTQNQMISVNTVYDKASDSCTWYVNGELCITVNNLGKRLSATGLTNMTDAKAQSLGFANGVSDMWTQCHINDLGGVDPTQPVKINNIQAGPGIFTMIDFYPTPNIGDTSGQPLAKLEEGHLVPTSIHLGNPQPSTYNYSAMSDLNVLKTNQVVALTMINLELSTTNGDLLSNLYTFNSVQNKYLNARGEQDPNAQALVRAKIASYNIVERSKHTPLFTAPGATPAATDGPYLRVPFVFDDGEVFDTNLVYTSSEFDLPIDIATITDAQKRILVTKFVMNPSLQDSDNNIIPSPSIVRPSLSLQQNGKWVIQIPGSMLQSQPIIMQYTHDKHANKHVLDKWEANLFNFYGVGIYTESSIYTDANGNCHLCSGGSNGNYAPASDEFCPSIYAAEALQKEIPTRFGFTSDELTQLGLANVASATLGAHNFPDFNTAILDNNGNLIMDCSIKGMRAFYENAVNNSNLSGVTLCKVKQLYMRQSELRALVWSPRGRRCLIGCAFVLNMKNLSLEYIIRGKYDEIECFDHEEAHSSVTMKIKDIGYNRDETGGVVFAGTGNYASSVNKRCIKMFNKQLINLSNMVFLATTVKNADGTIKSSPNFAVIDEGALGFQHLDSNRNSHYGVAERFVLVNTITNFSGNGFLGTFNNQDVFIDTRMVLGQYNQILEIDEGTLYTGFDDPNFISPNVFNPMTNSFGPFNAITKTSDNVAYKFNIMPPFFMWSQKVIIAYYFDEPTTSIKFKWIRPVDLSAGLANAASLVVNDIVFATNTTSLLAMSSLNGSLLKTWKFGTGYGINSPFNPYSQGPIPESPAPGIVAGRGCITVLTGFNKLYNQNLVGKRLYHLSVPLARVPQNLLVRSVPKQAILDKYSDLLE